MNNTIAPDKKTESPKTVYRVVKRAVDIVGGLVGIVLMIPITVILYIINLFSKENRGPVFFVQIRVGKDGKLFKMYKYRSMIVNADEKLWEYLSRDEDARLQYQKYKKIKDDPRITKVGKILRKTSLDELPQMINCVIGNMSLVGPRPYLEREIEDMGSRYDEIVSVKPGLTGYWQVNGRADVSFEERTVMDVHYVKNRNLMLDFKILIRTFAKAYTKGRSVY